MAKRPRWIVIPNWDELQHYKDRDPLWIKNYRKLLAKPEYLKLTLPQRGILHGLWLMYAESHREIPVNTAYLSRALHGRVTNASLVSLNRAGFIAFSASKPLAPRYQDASLEKETEREEETEKKERKSRAVRFEVNGQPSDVAEVIDISLRGASA